MCGFVGFFSKLDVPASVLSDMLGTINHRGPDSCGTWSDKLSNLKLGHARLAIQDVSQAGHQPMGSSSNRFTIVFNGEIYNHLDLREDLQNEQGIDWNGHSDTETLLSGFEVWGIKETIEKCVGMFAIAVWDGELRQLSLIRDRFGEKPLYYGWQNNIFMFASELKALKFHPYFENKINRNALNYFFRLNYIPTPFSIYESLYKLEPGAIATFSTNGELVEKETYWDIEAIFSKSNKIKTTSDEELVNKLESLIKRSVSEQKISDVPLGAFLSGGIDSSVVVGVLQSLSDKPIKTFTIGFEDPEFNEADDAAAVAKHLGTEHKELILSPDEIISVIERLPAIYDEPFSDASQLPTFLVSQLVKKDVKVVLSGDGGDELFCGYNRYHYTAKVWSKLQKLPLFLRKFMSDLLLSVSPSSWDKFAQVVHLNKKVPNLGNKVQKGAQVLKASSIHELYTRILSNWDVDEHLVKESSSNQLPLLSDTRDLEQLNDLEKMMLWDMQSYLMDGVLVKTDRATMACSLEGRVPLLDYRIAEFSAKLPIDIKLKDGKGKWLLRKVLYRYVPKELIERPKKGFSLPIADWLRGPLKEWAEKLLNSEKLEKDGFLSESLVHQKWNEHSSGKRDWSKQLWSVLMFQLWLEKNR